MRTFRMNYIEHHGFDVQAENEKEAFEKAEKLLEAGELGDTYLSMEWGSIECPDCGRTINNCNCGD